MSYRALYRTLLLLSTLASSAAAEDVLRLRPDRAHEREWVLTPRGVVVVDLKSRATTFVALDGWVVGGEAYVCPPDLAIGPKGEAVVSSNVLPVLWRIDPVSLKASKHELIVDAHAGKDIGFTGLAYSARMGAYVAVSPFGALWRIDPLLRRAQSIALDADVAPACGIAEIGRTRLCVQGSGRNRVIHLSPDQRSAYVWPFATCSTQPASSSMSP